MISRKLAFLLAVAVIAGCTTAAPSQGYRPPGSTASPWQISGELFDFTNVKIFVNGVKVIDERLSLLSGDGEFHSSYRGKQISANCYTDGWGGTKCLVFVDNRRQQKSRLLVGSLPSNSL